MTIFYLWIGLVVCLATVSLNNWRLGCVFWIAIACFQDPIRKVVPGNPTLLTLSFLPVYLVSLFGIGAEFQTFGGFAKDFPVLVSRFGIFFLSVVTGLVVAVLSTGHSTMAALTGMVSYLGAIPAILIGYWYLKRNFDEFIPLIVIYVGCTSVMLIGTPLEVNKVDLGLPLLGQVSGGEVWYRWFNEHDYVAMISGFYRAPEILGWHAMALVVFCLYLIVALPRWSFMWSALIIWGTYSVFMSGRRKMILIALAFIVCFAFFSGKKLKSKFLTSVIILSVFLVPIVPRIVGSLYILSLNSGVAVTGSKYVEKGVSGPLWLIPLVGPFGYGVGTVSQGSQHFARSSEVPLAEGGAEKVLIELGWLGVVAAFMFAGYVFRECFNSLRLSRRYGVDESGVVFTFSFLVANMAAFVVAFQFLGDPFIGSLLGFFVGCLLSVRRLKAIPIVRPSKSGHFAPYTGVQ